MFAPVLTFVIFSIIARDGSDRNLDTAVAFTALSLFALLSDPLASLVMSLTTFLGAVGSFNRIQQFLESEERTDKRKVDVQVDTTKSAPEAIAVQEADFGWDPAKQALLKGITMSVPWRKLTMVVGPVGCGKSTLLLALLGEVPALSGSVRLGSTSVAYCAQKPWHMNGTIRQAIVGSEKFDELWYMNVVRACALLQDFREMPMGDSTRLGSGGTALSGGQSQRVVRFPWSNTDPKILFFFPTLALIHYSRHWLAPSMLVEKLSSWMIPSADSILGLRTTCSIISSARMESSARCIPRCSSFLHQASSNEIPPPCAAGYANHFRSQTPSLLGSHRVFRPEG